MWSIATKILIALLDYTLNMELKANEKANQSIEAYGDKASELLARKLALKRIRELHSHKTSID